MMVKICDTFHFVTYNVKIGKTTTKNKIGKITKKNNLEALTISEEAITKLTSYHYPGNVRELKSIIDLACVLTNGSVINPEDIVFNDLATGYTTFDNANQTLKEHNKRLIENLLKKYNNNVRLVAQKLGIGKSTIYRLLK